MTPLLLALTVSAAGGVVSAGSYSGGFTPSAQVTWSVGDRLSYGVSGGAMLTGLTYRNPGLILTAGPSAWVTLGEFTAGVTLGGSLFWTVMCGRQCNRVLGLDPSGELSLLYKRSWYGVRVDAFGAWVVRGAVYNGPWGGLTLGPYLRWR